MSRKRHGRNIITNPFDFFFSLMMFSAEPFTARLIEPSFIAAAIMSVINVAVSCSRFVDFSHKELKELYRRTIRMAISD